MSTQSAFYKPDKWGKAMGTAIPAGAAVTVVRRFARRRVVVEHDGQRVLTFLWCLAQPVRWRA